MLRLDAERDEAAAAVVAGVCADWQQARTVVEQLRAVGVPRQRIRLIAGDPEAAAAAAPASARPVLLGTAGGIGLGGLMGTLAGVLLDASAAAEAELAMLLAETPLAELVEGIDPLVIAGASLGVVTGGLLGLHAGCTAGAELDREYARRVAAGGIMVRVEAPDGTAATVARVVLQGAGATELRTGL